MIKRLVLKTFYHIDHVRPVNHLCCIVISGCREYVVAESEESIHAKIEQIMAFKWN